LTTLDAVRRRAEDDARSRGYYLHPDPKFLNDLLEGLRKNEERYGYPSCPCRLATGRFEQDRDIVCPCDYRDIDVEEYGCCYCALYVRRDVFEGKTELGPIPERRPPEKQEPVHRMTGTPRTSSQSSLVPTATDAGVPKARMKMWYCRQCGYVAFRENPPYVCPICKAKREMFAEVPVKVSFEA